MSVKCLNMVFQVAHFQDMNDMKEGVHKTPRPWRFLPCQDSLLANTTPVNNPKTTRPFFPLQANRGCRTTIITRGVLKPYPAI